MDIQIVDLLMDFRNIKKYSSSSGTVFVSGEFHGVKYVFSKSVYIYAVARGNKYILTTNDPVDVHNLIISIVSGNDILRSNYSW